MKKSQSQVTDLAVELIKNVRAIKIYSEIEENYEKLDIPHYTKR
jgi:hypothetical protein